MTARVLVVEDDPVSAAFLCDVLRRRHTVSHSASLADARGVLATADAEHAFDLALIDLHLDDGSGIDLLRLLCAPPGGTARTTCIALSAELDPPLVASLRAMGCANVLGKPLTVAQLEHAVAQALGDAEDGRDSSMPGSIVASASPPIWDDAAALRALGGQQDVLDRLRGLLLQDLPGHRTRIIEAHAQGDHATLDAELHRLRAACGFCGAVALGSACAQLKVRRDKESLRGVLLAVAALMAARA
ncbi:MAG: response regulator [Xanthomonadales bacterium]|nr:response regulator [Xanthomonadales bacterium]